MGFPKFRKAKTAVVKDTAPAAPTAPKERIIYVPKHAVRDAMQIIPSGSAEDEQLRALRQAHEERAIREEFEANMSLQDYPICNPKMALSRTGLSMATPVHSSARSARSVILAPYFTPHASTLSLPALVPSHGAGSAIAAHLSSRTSSAGPSTPTLSRSSSFYPGPQIQPLEGQLNLPFNPRYAPSIPSVPASPTLAKAPIRSFSSHRPVSSINLKTTHWETPEEAADIVVSGSTSSISRTPSQTNSTSSVSSISEERVDSTQSSPVIDSAEKFTPSERKLGKAPMVTATAIERDYPNDPRALGKAPVITSLEVAPKPPTKYFRHSPQVKAAIARPEPERRGRFGFLRRSPAVSAF